MLVFADQVTTRTTDNQSGGGTAMLRVSAVDAGGRWKIDNMEMFGATAEQNQPAAGLLTAGRAGTPQSSRAGGGY